MSSADLSPDTESDGYYDDLSQGDTGSSPFVSWGDSTTMADPSSTRTSYTYGPRAWSRSTSKHVRGSSRDDLHTDIIAEDFPLYPGLPDFQDTFYQLHDSNNVTTCTIHMNATISKFVASELDGQFPCNLVVLSGALYNVWAATCEEYVNKTWPQRAHAILRLFELLGEMKPGATVLNQIIDFGQPSKDALEVTADLVETEMPLDPDSVLTVHLTARPSDLALFVEAMAWLYTVMQPQEAPKSQEDRVRPAGNLESSGKPTNDGSTDIARVEEDKRLAQNPNQADLNIRLEPTTEKLSVATTEKKKPQILPPGKVEDRKRSSAKVERATTDNIKTEKGKDNNEKSDGKKLADRDKDSGSGKRRNTTKKQIIDPDPFGTAKLFAPSGKPLDPKTGTQVLYDDPEVRRLVEKLTGDRSGRIDREDSFEKAEKNSRKDSTFMSADVAGIPGAFDYEAILPKGKKTKSGRYRSRSRSRSKFTPEMVRQNLQRGGITNVICSLNLVSSSNTTFAFKLKPHLEALVSSNDDKMVSSCWLPLMPNTTIASGHTSRSRAAGIKGLEVSFDLMCYLCGIEYEVVDDNGVVLFGHSSIAYPVRATEDSLEWHFRPVPKRKQSSLVLHQTRLKVDDLELLREYKRHFIGLWADPRVTLGTESSDVTKIGWTTAREKRQEYIPDGRSVGGTFNLPRLVGFNGAQIYKVAHSRKSPYLAGAMDFMTQLDTKVNDPVILYSVNEQRAWMVSFASVLLHLGRARASNQSRLGFQIDACVEAADGGLAAFEHIRNCRRKPLKVAAENEILDEEEKSNTVQDYLKLVWAALDHIERERHKAKGLFRDEIIGYEMADIAYWKSKLHMKCHPLAGFRRGNGWAPLLNEVDVVLFCEGLDDPIKANPAKTQEDGCLGDRWTSIPKGFDILTVSLPCLTATCQRFNPRGKLSYLTSRHAWHTPAHSRQVFGNCGCKRGHQCNKLQELRDDGDPGFGSLRFGNDPPTQPSHTDLQAHPSGAVIFRYSDGIATIENVLESRWPGYTRIESNRPEPSLPEEVVTLVKPPVHKKTDSGYSTGSRPGPSSPIAGPSSIRVPESTTHPHAEFEGGNILWTTGESSSAGLNPRRGTRPQSVAILDDELAERGEPQADEPRLTIISGEDDRRTPEDATQQADTTPQIPFERQHRHRQSQRQRARPQRSRNKVKKEAECCVM